MATCNASLNRGAEGQLLRDLSTPGNEQAQNIAEVIQINAPDVVLVHEFDHVPGGRAAEAFRDHHLSVSRNGVFWPKLGEPGSGLTSDPALATDHHLVWVDMDVPGQR